jgi:hypothetical protein
MALPPQVVTLGTVASPAQTVVPGGTTGVLPATKAGGPKPVSGSVPATSNLLAAAGPTIGQPATLQGVQTQFTNQAPGTSSLTNYNTVQPTAAQQALLQQTLRGNTSMADLTGKTGDDLSKELIKKQTEQAEQAALDPKQEIVPVTLTEQTNEILTDANVKMSTVSAPVPSGLSASMYNQTAPAAQAANNYQAAAVTQPANMQAAQGTVNPQALVNAAQGTLSPQALATAQTATMDPQATTQYQMGQLMSSIQAGQPLPAWAAPQVRKVSSIMQQRGLGSSSMAAAAMVQAVTESGIEIAKQDADKYSTLQLANLSNQQQAELQNAVAVANMDMANLNNRQTAAVQNAKTFLAIDTQNLTNQQQAQAIDYQSKVQMKLSDQAAENASLQFNAKSSNEVDMFFAELGSQIESANKNRSASIDQFNVNQQSGMEQFNASMEASRQQFNANMQSTIDQSNVAWRRNINTANTAAQNVANQQNVQTLLSMNQNSLNNLWQLYRDQASWAMQASENDRARAHNAAMQSAQIDANKSLYDSQFNNFLVTRTIDSIFM